MNIINFDSTEELAEFLKEQRHTDLAPAQAAIVPGDTWVCFHDLDNAHIVWGQVMTEDEANVYEAKRLAREDAEDPESTALLAVQMNLTNGNATGLLPYNLLDDRFGLAEVGPWHRAHLWPVDPRCYAAAREAEWDHRKIEDEAMRLLLDIAFRQARAHHLPKYGQRAGS